MRYLLRKEVPLGYCKKCYKPLGWSGLLWHGECPDDAHEEAIGDVWDRKGTHELKNGDHVTIYDKDDPTKIVWTGIFHKSKVRIWAHADAYGIDRQVWRKWFVENYPATLIVAK